MRKFRKAVLLLGVLLIAFTAVELQPYATKIKPSYGIFKIQKANILEEEQQIYSELIRWQSIGKARGYFDRDYTGYDDMVRDDPEFAEFDRRRKDMERRKKELMARYPDERGW